jgi:two-component system LytT family response regulator
LPIRSVIVDDERPARLMLKTLLGAHHDIEVVGEAASGTEAVELIEEVRPDVAFLDLVMPELDGVGVVLALERDRLPMVVFVTAYEEYAVRAFELNAVDYLLKPVSPDRLGETLSRVRGRLRDLASGPTPLERIKTAAVQCETLGGSVFPERLPVRQGQEVVILPVRQIISAVAQGELIEITTTQGVRYSIDCRLKRLASRLDPQRFIVLSRGALVNIDMIATVSPMPGGSYVVTLKNAERHQVSRIRSRALRDRLLRF